MTQPTFDTLLHHAARLCGVHTHEIIDDIRRRPVTLARRILTVVLHEQHRLSYPEIAARLGRKSHSAFVVGANKLAAKLEQAEESTGVLSHDDDQLS